MKNSKNVLLFSFFIIFLIIPILYRGISHQKPFWTPRHVRYLYHVAELFPQKPPNLPIFYMQLRFGEQEEWVTLNEREYFPISKGLGYRTRFSRLSEIYFISSGMAANFVGAELAEWVAAAYTQKNPGMHPPTAFRIVGANYTIGSRKDLAYWSDPPMDFFAPEQTVVIAEHSYKR